MRNGQLRSVLDARGWSPSKSDMPGSHSRPDCNVTLRERKVVVAARGRDFVLHTLEAEVTQAPKLGYDEVLHPIGSSSTRASMESERATFRPVVAATVIADKTAIEEVIKAV